MLQFIYRVALVLVVVCVLVVLIAPDVDLPDSTTLRAYHGVHVVLSSIDLTFTLLLLALIAFFSFKDRNNSTTRFDSHTRSLLCTFLC
ncbi:MAG TPA: hypothetical protein VI685_21405 [Candidatus Angelobacter sp.]